MTEKQEIRAKALEIAVMIRGVNNVSILDIDKYIILTDPIIQFIMGKNEPENQ